ncbi:MAG: carboxyl-terminal processing protease [Miltoncostaeaceae bacterium]|nr:carboxyl-terminal processing protease [Miltoncostaeaceae bacterium]
MSEGARERRAGGEPKPPRLHRSERVLLAALLALAVFLAGIAVGGHPGATGLDRLPEPARRLLLGSPSASLADQVLAVLQRRYYEPIDAAALERRSVDAMLASLRDPYTTYLDPDRLRRERQRIEGVYVGVGVALATRGEAVLVQRVYPRSPAARAGIRTGDRLRAVDGRPIRADAVGTAAARISGPLGSTVRLQVGRAGTATRSLTLRRERVRVPVVQARLARRGGQAIGVVDLLAFTSDSARSVRRAVAALRDRGARALVIDLRGDPGGLLDQAIAIAGVFLPSGSVVVTTQGEHEPRRTLRTKGEPTAGDLPLAVLVDRASASASEVLAAALRDAGRATVVGSRTFGKALVQDVEPLPGGGALKLTIARYRTPAGLDIQGVGLKPSVRAADDPRTPPDEALERALRTAAAAVRG